MFLLLYSRLFKTFSYFLDQELSGRQSQYSKDALPNPHLVLQTPCQSLCPAPISSYPGSGLSQQGCLPALLTADNTCTPHTICRRCIRMHFLHPHFLPKLTDHLGVHTKILEQGRGECQSWENYRASHLFLAIGHGKFIDSDANFFYNQLKFDFSLTDLTKNHLFSFPFRQFHKLSIKNTYVC